MPNRIARDDRADWPHSSFHEYVRRGIYPVNWGGEGLTDLRGGE